MTEILFDGIDGQTVGTFYPASLLITTCKSDTDNYLEQRTVWFVIGVILQIGGLPINFILLVLFIKQKIFHQEQYLFIMSLTIADTLFLSLGLSVYITTLYLGYWSLGYAGCQIIGVVAASTIMASIFCCTCIALARFMCVVHTKIYKKYFQKKHCLTIITCMWIWASLLAVTPVFGWGKIIFARKYNICFIDFSHSISYTTAIIIFASVVPLIIIIYSHVMIFLTVKRSKKQIHDHQHSTQENKPNLRLVLQLIVIVVVFFGCYTPGILLVMIIDPKRQLPFRVYQVCIFFLLLKSVVNPWIFLYFNKRLRQEVRKIFTCKCIHICSWKKWNSTNNSIDLVILKESKGIEKSGKASCSTVGVEGVNRETGH